MRRKSQTNSHQDGENDQTDTDSCVYALPYGSIPKEVESLPETDHAQDGEWRRKVRKEACLHPEIRNEQDELGEEYPGEQKYHPAERIQVLQNLVARLFFAWKQKDRDEQHNGCTIEDACNTARVVNARQSNG